MSLLTNSIKIIVLRFYSIDIYIKIDTRQKRTSFPFINQMTNRNRESDSKSVFKLPRSAKDLEDKYNERKEQLRAKAKIDVKDQRYYTIKANFSYLLSYHLSITHEIGRGGYGVVYKATSEVPNESKKEVAVKINFKTVAKQIAFIESSFLTLCRKKRNLSQLINIIQHDNRTHIISQHFPYTHFIDLFSTLNVEDIKHYLIQLLIGLRSLKEVGIFHRDIKPGNFLYNPETKVGLIIDFGLAEIDHDYVERHKSNKTQIGRKSMMEYQLSQNLHQKIEESLQIVGRNKIGTESYMPIESLLKHENQSYESDIWPIGVILLQFVLRKYNIFNHIKDGKGLQQQKEKKGIKNNYIIYYLIELATFFGRDAVMSQCRKLGYYLQLPQQIPLLRIRDVAQLEGYSQELENLLFRLLELDVEKRIKVQEAIKHPFFDSVRSSHNKKGGF